MFSLKDIAAYAGHITSTTSFQINYLFKNPKIFSLMFLENFQNFVKVLENFNHDNKNWLNFHQFSENFT